MRAAQAGTVRVARIVTASQGRELPLGIAFGQRPKGTRKIHVSYREQLPVIGLQHFFPIVRGIRAGAPQQSGVDASAFIK